jgi:sugar phosphate permease
MIWVALLLAALVGLLIAPFPEWVKLGAIIVVLLGAAGWIDSGGGPPCCGR